MTSVLLEPFLNQTVMVATNDGKVLKGQLTGFDPQCNLVLVKCVERIFSTDEPVEVQEHGLLLIRGDNVACIGEVDSELDASIDWNLVKADPLKPIRH